MNKLYDALENCLENIEQGQDLDTVLAYYPKLAKQLRPMLEASIRARNLTNHTVPAIAQRRVRARLLQRASEMREEKRARRRVIPVLSRWALTFGMVGALFLGSTGLVSAASSTLPGDQLYPVKRTWEDVRLLFVFSPQAHDVLTSQYEQERLNEIDELLMKGRPASIVFSGLVTSQQNGQWQVSGIPVSVTGSTRLTTGAVSSGVPVTVVGVTRSDGVVEAMEIQLLQPGVSLPPLEPSGDNDANGETDNENHVQPVPTAVAILPVTPPPAVVSNLTPTPLPSQPEQKGYEFSGVVESMQGNVWVINGQTVIAADQAQIQGTVGVGSWVKFEGYYDSNGQFIVTQVEVKTIDRSTVNSNSGNSGNNSGSNDNGNSNHNENDDNHYDYHNNNYNSNQNTNDHNENGH